jgi:hypothetical protein
MQDEATLLAIESKYRSLSALMDERMRRQWVAAESRAYGWGGVRAVSSVIGMSPNTIRKGMAELARTDEDPHEPVQPRLRAIGAGRKKSVQADPQLMHALESLVEPRTRSDPQSALRWTCKSKVLLAQQLTRQRHAVSARTVGRLLNEADQRLFGPSAGQSNPLRRIRPQREPSLGQCGHRPRHGVLRQRGDSQMVEEDGSKRYRTTPCSRAELKKVTLFWPLLKIEWAPWARWTSGKPSSAGRLAACPVAA